MNSAENEEQLRRKPTIVASALIRKGDKYLLTRDEKFDFWRPPGGRMDWGESAEDTLRREMAEELGVQMKIIKPLGFGEDFPFINTRKYKTHRIILYFLCESDEEITYFKDEESTGNMMKWVTKEELLFEKEIEPALKNIMDKI